MSQQFDFGPPTGGGVAAEPAFNFGPPQPSTAEAAVRGIVQGLTADWSDEAAGALDFLKVALSPKGKPTRADYEKGRDESRAANEAARQAHPTAYGAGHIAGDIGLGAAGMAVGGPVAAGAILGGANAAGASTSSNPLDVATSAVKGAAGGALAGKIGQMGFGALGKAMNKASPMMGKASDALAAKALGADASPEVGDVFRRMVQSGRNGELSERAGRLGLLNSLSWAGRREAAQVAREKVAQETGAVMNALDGTPGIDKPNIQSLFAGVGTNPRVSALVEHATEGTKNSEVMQKFLAPLASTDGWAGRHAALEALREDVRPTLAKMAAGQAVSAVDEARAIAYRAAAGVFNKEAQDAAERGGQEILGAQLASLNKDEALAGLTARATTDKIESEGKGILRSRLLKAAYQAATAKPLRAAATLAGGPEALTPLAAKAAGAMSKLPKASPVMGKVGRLVTGSGDDVAARVMGERQGQDDLTTAAAHMVAQQSSPSYQKKAGDLAKRLSKEKPR